MPVCSYHRWFGYPFVTLPMQEWAHCSPWYTLRYHYNYSIKEWSSCTKKGFSPFPPPHMKMNGYCHHYKQFLNPGKRCRCQSNSFRFGVTCFDNNNTCSNNCVQNKTQSYVEQTLGNDFIPLAIETYSYLHPCFDSFLISCVHAYIVRH